MGTPSADVHIEAGRIRQLLAVQHPDLAELPIVPVACGWDNAMFRLGDSLALRLPRRKLAVALIENEQRWLADVGRHLPLNVPAPVRVGVAQDWYPWPWSITPWLDGETADLAPPDRDQGEELAKFLSALHRPAPSAAPRNPYRGVPLVERVAAFDERVAKLRGRTAVVDQRALAIWSDALAAPNDAAPTWIHGDLHPRNVLVVGGRLSGVIDWGDMARGDPASDLAAIWMLLPQRESRQRAIDASRGVSADTWRRARGWAMLYALILAQAGLVDDPRMTAIAERTVERLLDGP
jgi:aminoglycoside phosphotransferase (APT) family kinase protein